MVDKALKSWHGLNMTPPVKQSVIQSLIGGFFKVMIAILTLVFTYIFGTKAVQVFQQNTRNDMHQITQANVQVVVNNKNGAK